MPASQQRAAPAPAAPAGGTASPAGPPGDSQASRYHLRPGGPIAVGTYLMVFMCVFYLWTGACAEFLIAFPTLLLWMAVTR
jgi:hypothetical protein